MTRRIQIALITIVLLMATSWAALSLATADDALLPIGHVPMNATGGSPVACCEVPIGYPAPPTDPYPAAYPAYMPVVVEAYPYPQP